jgi:hypothetical protein
MSDEPMAVGPTSPERLRGAFRRVILLLRLPAGLLALVGLLLALLVHVAALRGIDSEANWPQVWLLHAAVFPLILLAVLTPGTGSGQRTPSFRELLALIPWPVLLLIGLALIYVLAAFVLLIPESAGGAPLIKDGHFFFNGHGVVREVTESEFHFQRSISLRIYSSVWAYLYLVAAVLLLCARRAPKTELRRG